MNTRTDMAHEALQRCRSLSGVEEENESKGRMRISRIRVRTQAASRKLDKPKGSYITLTLPEDGLVSREVRQEAGRGEDSDTVTCPRQHDDVDADIGL